MDGLAAVGLPRAEAATPINGKAAGIVSGTAGRGVTDVLKLRRSSRRPLK
jgi:hypothetical protein